MPHEVFPLRVHRDSAGVRCVVHCPACRCEVLVHADSASAKCPCGAELTIVIRRVLYGTWISSSRISDDDAA